MSYDVFISFKNSGKDGKATPDALAARSVYEALKAEKIKAFFSEESLAEVGKGQFGKSIETALESSKVLILVASCREHIESPWVEAEWDSFLQTVRSGHKEGELFIFNCGDLNPGELPLFLRRQQMFAKDSMSKLVQFVASAVPNEPTLKDYVHVSLHCYRPENNEDKVYLVTVHPGHSAGMFHVTAHWGARTAKRLSSQLKAINVTKEKANAEVVKAKQEKVKGGYLPAPLSKVLSDEARSHLAASMGVSAAEPSKAKSNAAPKVKAPSKDKAPTKVKTPEASPAKAPQAKSVKAPTKKVAIEPVKSPTKVASKTKSTETKVVTVSKPAKASPKKTSKTEDKLPAKALPKKAAKSAK
jgi:hypothetical protein